jgi:hypothetical protein
MSSAKSVRHDSKETCPPSASVTKVTVADKIAPEPSSKPLAAAAVVSKSPSGHKKRSTTACPPVNQTERPLIGTRSPNPVKSNLAHPDTARCSGILSGKESANRRHFNKKMVSPTSGSGQPPTTPAFSRKAACANTFVSSEMSVTERASVISNIDHKPAAGAGAALPPPIPDSKVLAAAAARVDAAKDKDNLPPPLPSTRSAAFVQPLAITIRSAPRLGTCTDTLVEADSDGDEIGAAQSVLQNLASDSEDEILSSASSDARDETTRASSDACVPPSTFVGGRTSGPGKAPSPSRTLSLLADGQSDLDSDPVSPESGCVSALAASAPLPPLA